MASFVRMLRTYLYPVCFCAWVLVQVLFVTSYIFLNSLIAMVIGLPFYLLWVCISIGFMCDAIILWARRKNTCRRFIETCCAFIFVASLFNMHMFEYFGDGIYLFVMEPQFDKQVAALQSPVVTEWDRGGMLFAGVAIVYDDSDQIDLDPKNQSASFINRTVNTDLKCGHGDESRGARHYWGHYYFAFVGC